MFIGISAYNHESAIALVDNNGNLIDYYREESLSRIKGDKSFPKRALKRIFNIHNLNTDAIEKVIFYEKPLSAFLFPLKEASKFIPESMQLIVNQIRNFKKSSLSCYLDIAKEKPGLEKKLIYIDHHLSHTLTTLFYSDYQNDVCSIVVDGFGDRSTTSISYVRDKYNIKELWSSSYPNSIGLYYSSITDFLGFTINEGEYKVMGLSAYGDSNSKEAKLVNKLMKWDSFNNKIILDLEFFSFYKSITDSYGSKLISMLGEPRNPFAKLLPGDLTFQKYANIARGAQDSTNNVLSKIFNYAHSITRSENFLFSGGVALNSASVNYISELDFVNKLIVPPSPGDSGAAIGASLYGYLKSKNVKCIEKPSLYPSNYSCYDQYEAISKLLDKNYILVTDNHIDSIELACRLIKEGEVIGTIISNSETGPRALGNRSLICNGANSKSVKKLNNLIKDRSPFRPTAPAMKKETAYKYFELNPAVMSSYKTMTATCKCKKDSISLSFPTTHVDGTARIQIVEEETILWELLDKLIIEGIDIIANSSLNISGDPTCFDLIDGLMVCSITPLKYLLTDIGMIKKR